MTKKMKRCFWVIKGNEQSWSTQDATWAKVKHLLSTSDEQIVVTIAYDAQLSWIGAAKKVYSMLAKALLTKVLL